MQRPWAKSAESIPWSCQPPTPSATPKAQARVEVLGFESSVLGLEVGGEGGPTFVMKTASWPLARRPAEGMMSGRGTPARERMFEVEEKEKWCSLGLKDLALPQ